MTKNNAPLRGAIIGYGFIATHGHFPAYVERMKRDQDVEIIAICDICPTRSEDLPENIRFYTDYMELLEQEAANLDFVDIATHAAQHAEIVHKALEYGCHVLCEKPITTTIEDAQNIIRHAKEANRVLFPCHNYKHAPIVKEIRSIIQSGKIGAVRSATISTYRNTHAIGQKDWLPDWRRHNELSGGGIAMDHGSHSLYLLFEWFSDYPVSVTASGQNLVGGDFDTEDNFTAVYEFPKGMATVHLTWTAGVRKVIYTIQGDKGALTIDDNSMEIALMSKNEDDETSSHKASWNIDKREIVSDWMDSSHVNWFNSMFDKFKTAILNDDIENDEINDAYHCILSIQKAYHSMAKNSAKLELDGAAENGLIVAPMTNSSAAADQMAEG